MRAALIVTALVVVGLAGAAPVAAQTPAPAPAACLGGKAEPCVAALRGALTLDEEFIAASLERRHQVDVNGRSLGGGLMTVSGRLRGRREPLLVALHLSPDDTVRSVEAALPNDPVEARTEQEYADTGLYQMLSPLIGARCPEMATPLALYQFFENVVKPRMVTAREDAKGGLFGGHTVRTGADGVPFCGVRFTVRRTLEWRGAADPHYARNPSGHFAIKLE